jgi:predicted glycosyltransferase involved in capsule biosynthesis
MYFETYSDSKFAEHREVQIKKYRREKKIALFKDSNPQWKDLYPELFVSIGVARYGPGFPSSPKTLSKDRDPSLRSGFQKKAK